MAKKIPRRPTPKDKLNFTLAFTDEDLPMLTAMREAANRQDRALGNWLRVRLRELFTEGVLTG